MKAACDNLRANISQHSLLIHIFEGCNYAWMIKFDFKISTVFVWFACLLSCYAVKAQGDQDYVRDSPSNVSSTESKKFQLSFSVGGALPYRDFASTDVKGSFWDQTSVDSIKLQGFAKPGLHFDFRLGYSFSDHFGLTLLIGGNTNQFDLNAFTKGVGYPSTTATTSYFTGEYMIGPTFSYAINDKWKLNASLMAGFVKNNYPQVTFAVNDTINVVIAFNGGDLSFAYSAELGVSYSINSYIDINASVSYLQSTIHYPGWVQTIDVISPNPAYYYLPLIIYHNNDITAMSIAFLKPCVGIVIKF